MVQSAGARHHYSPAVIFVLGILGRMLRSQATPFFKRFLVPKLTRRKFLGSAVAAGVGSRLAIEVLNFISGTKAGLRLYGAF